MFDQPRNPYTYFDHYQNFYRHIFPIELMTHLLTCEGRFPLSRCEFAFSVKDCIVRYQRFATPIERINYMEINGLTDLMGGDRIPFAFPGSGELLEYLEEKKPLAIHFGAVYPNVCRTFERQVDVEKYRPLVFDIDLNDYDRSFIKNCACGQEKKCCENCWLAFMRPALRIMNYFLEEVMCFQKVLPVFSGRRGIHIWVFDQRVWSWSKAQRLHFVNSVVLNPTGEQIERVLNLMRYRNSYAKGFDDRELFSFFYPKLDIDVTTELCHLSKIPFCAHPDTGFLCLPITDTFTPRYRKHFREISAKHMQAIVDSTRRKLKI